MDASELERYVADRAMKTLRDIENDMVELAQKIGASAVRLPTYGVSQDFARPHIEVDQKMYHFVVVERGREQLRKSTDSYDDLLYWIFSGVTSEMAFEYELRHRIEDQDCRRIAFPKKIELLNAISVEMGTKGAAEIEQILAKAPYDDEPTRRVNAMRRGNAI
jgi:hypothetical protein